VPEKYDFITTIIICPKNKKHSYHHLPVEFEPLSTITTVRDGLVGTSCNCWSFARNCERKTVNRKNL